MILRPKEINISVEYDKIYQNSQDFDDSSIFLESKIQETKTVLEEAINSEADNDKKIEFQNALKELNNIAIIEPTENHITFILKNSEEENNKYDKFKYVENNIEQIDSENAILDENENSIDALSEKIAVNVFVNNSSGSLDSSIEKIISSFLNDEIKDSFNQQDSGSGQQDDNPFDNGNSLMPFNISVSLASCKGLRREYLKMFREIKEKDVSDDIYADEYAKGITNVSMKYFSSGVRCITAHSDASWQAIGAGNSLFLDCSAGYNNCYEKLVSYYKKRNSEFLTMQKEAKNVSDAISAMYDNGTLNELITGTYIQPSSPPYTMPLIENNSSYKIDSSPGKNMLYITLLAAYKTMEKVSDASQKGSNIYSKIGVGKTFEDTDDVIATALAAGVKAMISMTKVQTKSVHSSNPGGSGLLLPIGA